MQAVVVTKLDEIGHESWSRVSERVKSEIGDAVFRSWIKPLSFVGIKQNIAVLAAPSKFMCDWVNNHYHNQICAAWNAENNNITNVEFCVQAAGAETRPVPESHVEPALVKTAPESGNIISFASAQASKSHNEDLYQCVLDPRYTFDNFVVGKPNELAHAAARRVAESPEVSPGCNPLFIYGGVGLGKTHLMHAIAWHIRIHNPNRKVMYLSAEKFMYEFIRSLRDKNTMSFKEQFRSVDVLMVDDVQFISGKDSTQEEFFHTFNALVDQNRQVIISGDRSPSDLDGIEDRVRSRLGWGLVVDVHATTYELRLGILQSKVEALKADVPNNVLEFLAHKITSNVRELEGALNRIVAHSTLVGRAMSIDTAHEVLRDLIRANDRRITVEEIQRKVAEHFNIKVSDMYSARRSRVVARPRQVAMFLAKKLTPLSLPEIGRKFGGKDHTTVMHAVKRVEELCGEDNGFREDTELLSRMLQSD